MDETSGFPHPGLSPRDRATADQLTAAVRKLSRSSVLVVGDAMLDRYVYGTVTRISREAPVPVLAVEREVAVPGGAGNVVRNLGALGVAVAFVSVVGDDQAGSDLTGLIGSQPGVEPWLLVQGSRTTTQKTRLMAQGQQLLRTDREDVSPIHPKLAERLLRIVRDAMAATSVTILSDYGKGVLSGDMPERLIACARGASRRVIADIHDTDFARYAGADVILPSHHDLERIAGGRLGTDTAVAEAAAHLRAAHGFGAVLVTRAEDGMTLVNGETVLHLRAEPSDIIDFAGAGDTTIAALGAAMAAGLDLGMAARIAHIAAGVVIGRHGLSVAREGDLLAAISPQGSALRKIMNLEAATLRVENWRREGWRTALALGSFDRLDTQQIEALRHARGQCDRLVIGLDCDKPNGVLQPEAVRAATLAALDCVDLVVMTDTRTPADLLQALRPDLLVGSVTQPGADLLSSWGGSLLAG
jgi:D-beta-D-heptose 7-phosphate kinase/D-beta-D-heptose 1-phosphate adenosyltransferase